ncbi:hypothetical protein AB0C74_23675 [Spirillospora sp. NPDC048832]
MERFETASMRFIPGQLVRARILSHHPWGVLTEIVGHPGVGSSIDMIAQFGATYRGDDLQAAYPPVGAVIDAVVQQTRRFSDPAWVRLSIRPEDLECFTWPCDFCGQRATLSPGGDGLVLDARSNDGPGSTTIIAHRTCLAERIRPENRGERARVLKVGIRDDES